MRCEIDNCKNESYQGEFFGKICMPCYTYITKEINRLENNISYSQVYRNTLTAYLDVLRQQESYILNERYKETMKRINND